MQGCCVLTTEDRDSWKNERVEDLTNGGIMKIQCYASIPLEQDEPVAGIRDFVRILRAGATETEKAEVDLNLVGVSARATTTIQEFKPGRTKGAGFGRALEIAEELTRIGPAKIKSLSFFLTAEGFRWKGSRKGTAARLALLDGKTFQRKQRFSFLATMSFEAADAKEAFIETMLAEIAKATGIRFELQASQMHLTANEPGRATPEELLVTGLAFAELVERVGEELQKEISLASVPHLMTAPEAMQFVFDPKKMGKSVKVDFTRMARKWAKTEFPEYANSLNEQSEDVLSKEIAREVQVSFSLDKKPRAFSKEFTIWLGVGLTSPRFAAAADRPFLLSLNLFRLFGIGPLPMKWTYFTETDLREALDGAAVLLRQVLAAFEPEAAQMGRAHERRLAEFAGPREVSAREAHEIALPLARAWVQDAELQRITSNAPMAWYLSPFSAVLPAINRDGRLAMYGGWWLHFYSRSKREKLYVTVPCYGPIAQTRVDAPEGRQWPTDGDQTLRDGWMDSIEAVRLARAAAEEKGGLSSAVETQQFELSSGANVAASGVLRPPFREGMFVMEAAWRILFPRTSEKERRIVSVTVPAHGGGAAVVEVHAYDKYGRPSAG